MTVAQARSIAQEWMLQLHRGTDPKDEIERQRREAQLQRDATFGKVSDRWLREHAQTKRRARRMTRAVELLLLPSLRERPIKDISRPEIRDLIGKLKEKHRKWQARTALATIKSIFNFAIGTESYDLTASPADRLTAESLVGALKPRQRFCNNDEIRALWLATDKLDPLWRDFYRVAMLLGQRRGEIAAIRKRWIDFDNKLMTIPSEVYKTDQVHVVPLTNYILDILKKRPCGVGNNDALFSFNEGKTPVASFARPFARWKKEAAKILDRPAGDLSFTLHDSGRRTFRTNLAMLGVPLEIAELCIGHRRRTGVVATYAVYEHLDEQRKAFEKYERFLLSSVAPVNKSKVVSLRRK